MNKIAIICLLGVMFPSAITVEQASEMMIARAEEVNPDSSDPLDDLLAIDDFKTAYLNGDYLADSTADDFDVIQTLEYGYSSTGSYSFYLYAFNKSGKEGNYNFSYSGNRVEMFVESSGSYGHFAIKYVNATDDFKFIKYRLSVSNSQFTKEDGSRNYSIIGMEIAHLENGQTGIYRLHDYSICHSWVYTGIGSSLQVAYASDYEHLELDVNMGCYQTASSSESATAKNNLFYCYFNVPSKFNGEDYQLYSVHADYYDFDFDWKIASIIDEHSYAFYLDLWNRYVGDDGVLDATEKADIKTYYDVSNNYLCRYFFKNTYALGDAQYEEKYFTYAPNHDQVSLLNNVYCYDNDHNLSKGAPLFMNVSSISEIVPFERIDEYLDLDQAEMITGQPRANVYKEIHYTNDKNPINDANFMDFNLLSYGDHHNGWSNFWSKLLSGTNTTEVDINNIPCIQKVGSDVTGSDSSVQQAYLVQESDASDLRDYYNSALSNLNDTYIFRFNTNIQDYFKMYWNWALNAGLQYADSGYMMGKYKVAIDFDIMDLTFINEYNELLQIPVVADPGNIGGDITPNTAFDWLGWLLKVLAIIGAIILVIVIIRIVVSVSQSVSIANTNSKVNKMSRSKKSKKKTKK